MGFFSQVGKAIGGAVKGFVTGGPLGAIAGAGGSIVSSLKGSTKPAVTTAAPASSLTINPQDPLGLKTQSNTMWYIIGGVVLFFGVIITMILTMGRKRRR